MKKYFVFKNYRDEEFSLEEDLIGLAETPAEIATLLAGRTDFIVYEFINERFELASRYGAVTNTIPNPDDPDNHKRRVVIYYLEMNDGTLHELKREKQNLVEPEPLTWIPSGGIISGNINLTSPYWVKETDEPPLPRLYITFGTPKTGS